MHEEFRSVQRVFDKKFRFHKRQHRSTEIQKLRDTAETDPNKMWKHIKSLSEPKSSNATLEVTRENGSVTSNLNDVLKRWHLDISNLFSGIREKPDLAFNDKFYDDICKLKDHFEKHYLRAIRELSSDPTYLPSLQCTDRKPSGIDG